MPTRLTAGSSARVLSNLHLRSAAGLEASVLRVNPAGTVLEVLSGPVCISPYQWWEVRAPDGTTGWSAEGRPSGGGYFLQPGQ